MEIQSAKILPDDLLNVKAIPAEKLPLAILPHKSIYELTVYKDALDVSSIVTITDLKGIITYANENFCRVSKYKKHELLGVDSKILNSSYHNKEFFSDLWTVISDGKIWRGEIKNKAKDGSCYWGDTTIVPFLDENEKPYQYISFCSDITKRVKLEEQQALFVSIVNSSEDAIVTRDLEGSITSWNHGAENLFGYKTAESIGKNISMLVPESRLKEESDIMEKVKLGESINHYDTQRLKKDGSLLNISLTISPIKDSSNTIIGASKIERDITARKLIEAEIKTLNEGLELKVKERTAELESVNKELEAFSYSVSHDLRAPLRAINGYAKMIAEDYSALFDGDGNRLLEVIRTSAKGMGLLIDDLLTFSRLGRKGLNRSVIDMTQLTKAIFIESGEINTHNATIIVNELHPVVADPTLIKQVVMNLVLNAIKYSSKADKPHIEVSSVQEDNFIVYSVKDNGVGFDMKYADKLFGVFQRLHSAKEFEGSGVGLALVQRIILKHGGKVGAEGKVNEGAVFYFSLPVILKEL